MTEDLNELFSCYVRGNHGPNRLLVIKAIEEDPDGELATRIRESNARAKNALNINWEELAYSLFSSQTDESGANLSGEAQNDFLLPQRESATGKLLKIDWNLTGVKQRRYDQNRNEDAPAEKEDISFMAHRVESLERMYAGPGYSWIDPLFLAESMRELARAKAAWGDFHSSDELLEKAQYLVNRHMGQNDPHFSDRVQHLFLTYCEESFGLSLTTMPTTAV